MLRLLFVIAMCTTSCAASSQVFRTQFSPVCNVVSENPPKNRPNKVKQVMCPPKLAKTVGWFERPWFVATITMLFTAAITIPSTLLAVGVL